MDHHERILDFRQGGFFGKGVKAQYQQAGKGQYQQGGKGNYQQGGKGQYQQGGKGQYQQRGQYQQGTFLKFMLSAIVSIISSQSQLL